MYYLLKAAGKSRKIYKLNGGVLKTSVKNFINKLLYGGNTSEKF